jgi:UDP-2,3-diacylglucosamine pyrophosphatase LpxH
MGDGGPRDQFQAHRFRLMKFLDAVVRDDALVIDGDLLEMWQCEVGDCWEQNEAIITRLLAMKARLVVGNHDAGLLGFWQQFPIFPELTVEGVRILHGHQFDPFNSVRSYMGQIMAILVGQLEPRFPKLEGFLDRATRWGRGIGVERFAARGTQMIVAGHTHKAKLGKNYVNVGCWNDSEATYAVIEDGKVSLHRYDYAS